MLRVLMILEDYGELMFLQTILKKMGFDVDAIQNPRSLAEHILSMNPDLMVMTASGKRVNGLELNKGVKRVRGNPKVILLQADGAPPAAVPNVEGYLTSPVGAVDFLNKMAEVCGLNAPSLQEKFQKLKLKEEEERTRILKIPDAKTVGPVLEKSGDGNKSSIHPVGLSTGSSGSSSSSLVPTSMLESEREERYKKFLDGKIPTKEGFSVRDVQAKIRELRKDEGSQDLDDLERERRAFVEHLFRRKA